MPKGNARSTHSMSSCGGWSVNCRNEWRSHVSSRVLITWGYTEIVLRCYCIYFRVYLLMIAMKSSDIMKIDDSFQTCSFQTSKSSRKHIGRCSSYLTVARTTKAHFGQQRSFQRRGLSERMLVHRTLVTWELNYHQFGGVDILCRMQQFSRVSQILATG